MDGVFLGLAGLLLGIFLGLCPREIPRSSPASPWKTPSIPPLLLGLTHAAIMSLKLYSMLILKENLLLFAVRRPSTHSAAHQPLDPWAAIVSSFLQFNYFLARQPSAL